MFFSSVQVLLQNLVKHYCERGFTLFSSCTKDKNLLSTETFCLAEIGYQPKYHTINIAATGSPFNSCLAKLNSA